MRTKHGEPTRGLLYESTAKADASGPGRFGKLFPKLKPAEFDHAALHDLADEMVTTFDPPKDGKDDEESGIPALYTYFGQFIDHDLTFDPEASFQKKKDPNALVDFRTPAFDLDSVYGRGPSDQPYMYTPDGSSFAQGDPLSFGDAGGRDLLRNPDGRALIGDPRNDENAIVSQLQGLFHRVHNRIVAQRASSDDETRESFEDAQLEVFRRYQFVVLHDFLPRIVSAKVLDDLKVDGRYKPDRLRFFDPKAPFMPVEFSGACYRFGHSMVRPGYRLNDATLLSIFPVPPRTALGFPEGLTGFRRMISDWGIDWGRFVDVDVREYGGGALANFKRLQLAYRIDTSLVDPLGTLPKAVAAEGPHSLALRNLRRGVQLRLPSGQEVADAMGVTPLRDEEILIGSATDEAEKPKPITSISPHAFKGKCPLWTYVLAEAAMSGTRVSVPVKENADRPGTISIQTPQLGPVGGRIVAEVFLGLMFADPMSLLNRDPDWTPEGRADYTLKDLVSFGSGHPAKPAGRKP